MRAVGHPPIEWWVPLANQRTYLLGTFRLSFYSRHSPSYIERDSKHPRRDSSFPYLICLSLTGSACLIEANC